MKKVLLTLLFVSCPLVLCLSFGQIAKCTVCGKATSHCPYKGNHPTIAPSATTSSRSIKKRRNIPLNGAISINSTPLGAVVGIDGRDMGKTPITLNNLSSGIYSIFIYAKGYEPQIKEVSVTKGETTTCVAVLEKEKSRPESQTINVNGISFKMIFVEGGSFTMGDTFEQERMHSDETPTHLVTVPSYYIGETEVTQAIWKAVMGTNPSYYKGDDHPVENVSWDDCQDFIRKLNKLTGLSFRLPTEAEWEFAARGGNRSKGYLYSGSNNIDEVAWHRGNSSLMTHPVKSKKPNELGLYDMSGNVWEQCLDWYGHYKSFAQINPQGLDEGPSHTRRGGGWGYVASFAPVCSRGNFFGGKGKQEKQKHSCFGLRLAL